MIAAEASETGFRRSLGERRPKAKKLLARSLVAWRALGRSAVYVWRKCIKFIKFIHSRSKLWTGENWHSKQMSSVPGQLFWLAKYTAKPSELSVPSIIATTKQPAYL